MRGLFAAIALVLALTAPLAAQDSLPPAPYAYKQLDDPKQEAEAKALMETLRCLTCQGQSIADSDAPMAGDLRHQVRVRIERGETPEAIRAWLIERYGEYISFKPEVTSSTWPLFVLPVLLLLVAVFVFRSKLGKKA